jgi:hypothetical protein
MVIEVTSGSMLGQPLAGHFDLEVLGRKATPKAV